MIPEYPLPTFAPTQNVQQMNGIVTDANPEWKDPRVEPPPRGVDMLCLQATGTLVKSPWMDGIGFLAWYPLPKLPTWAKELRRYAYFKNVKTPTSELNLETLKRDYSDDTPSDK